MFPSRLLTVLTLTGLLLLAACSDNSAEPQTNPEPESWNLIQSELGRDPSPDVTPADADALTAGNHAFALAVLDALDRDGNLLISPLSIRTAFSMCYAGALGQTAAEMETALRFGLPQEKLHPAWNGLDLSLASRNDPGDEDNPPVELHLTNAIWGRLGYPFQPDYLDLLAVNYGAGIHEIDFYGAPEASRLAINEWVEEQTRDRVQDLLPPDSIDAGTAVVLTNALYFKAPWDLPFDADSTETADFHRLDGSTTSVPMMTKTDAFHYFEDDGCQALEILFREEDLSMVLLLPADGSFTDFVGGLDVARLDGILGGLAWSGVEAFVPRFSFEYDCELKETLQGMGMHLPFTPAADFGGMTQSDGLYIDEAYHKTFIAVDEKGTEAAAATAITMREVSIPPGDYHFRADRPFLLLILDRPTQTILFLGRVLEP